MQNEKADRLVCMLMKFIVTVVLRRLHRVLPPRVCLTYTNVHFNAKSHKTKIEFFEFPSVNFLKFCTYQDITFVNLTTDFHKIQL